MSPRPVDASIAGRRAALPDDPRVRVSAGAGRAVRDVPRATAARGLPTPQRDRRRDGHGPRHLGDRPAGPPGPRRRPRGAEAPGGPGVRGGPRLRPRRVRPGGRGDDSMERMAARAVRLRHRPPLHVGGDHLPGRPPPAPGGEDHPVRPPHDDLEGERPGLGALVQRGRHPRLPHGERVRRGVPRARHDRRRMRGPRRCGARPRPDARPEVGRRRAVGGTLGLLRSGYPPDHARVRGREGAEARPWPRRRVSPPRSRCRAASRICERGSRTEVFSREGRCPAASMLLGAHVSIAGGFAQAPKAGKYIGCETIQIFSRSPRMLRRTKPIAPEEARAFWDGLKKAGILGTATHGNYLINLCATSARMLKVARTAFVEELERARTLAIPYVIFHPGAHMGKGESRGLRRIAESLDWALSRADAEGVSPLLEITAGQGTTLGSTWEQLREIIEGTDAGDRLGVCVDTCHTLAAGYDFPTPERYEAFVRQIDAVLGLRRVKAFHLNDSE